MEEQAEAQKHHSDSDIEIDPAIVSALDVHNIGVKERLQDADHFKYRGMTKFNQKSFKSALVLDTSVSQIRPSNCSSLR